MARAVQYTIHYTHVMAWAAQYTIHNTQYTYYGQRCIMRNTQYACYDTATQYTIRMLWPGLCNTQYNIHMLWSGLHNTQYTCYCQACTLHSIRGDTIPTTMPLLLVAMWPDVSHWRFFGHFWRHSSVKRESICAHLNGQRQSRRKRGVCSLRIFKCLRRKLSDFSIWRQNNLEAR